MTNRGTFDVVRDPILIACTVVFAILAKPIGILLGSMIGSGLAALAVALMVVWVFVAYVLFRELMR